MAKRVISTPAKSAPVTAKPVAVPAPVTAPAPVAAVPAPAVADTNAAKLASREQRNADYLATGSYPAEKLSPADRSYLAAFATSAKANGGTINLAALDLADRAVGRLVNNRARALRLAKFGFIVRTGDTAALSRFTFAPAVTATVAPSPATPNMLAVRTIYSSAK